MNAVLVAVTLASWAVVWCVGEFTARMLFGAGSRSVAAATRLPLGLAATLCLLEAAGYFLPIRWAGWLVLLPALGGSWFAVKERRRGDFARQRVVAASSLLALAVGLSPVVVAKRFTAAAMTNNDGTYYLTVADWLGGSPWSRQFPGVPPELCLVERVIHWWHWRTGTPNLMATVSAIAGSESGQSLAVVTALLFACVPCTTVGIARSLGVRPGSPKELLVGSIGALSAAPASLGFQHMTGHLGAHCLFPLVCAASLDAMRLGGWRRILHAALFMGAAVAMFADGSAVLFAIGLAALIANSNRLKIAGARAALIAVATALVAPFTLYRAGVAGFNTLRSRVPAPDPIFPQRGWLPRSPLDDLATLTGVDPWPPWPAAFPPTVPAVIAWTAALVGLSLFVAGLGRLRPSRGERSVAAVLGGVVLGAVVLLQIRYLAGKVLLTGAAFAVPLCAVGATGMFERRWLRWLGAVLLVGELVALGQLVRPARWTVVDTEAHDRLVRELAQVPPGAIVAFDGLGAPADAVLDAHRAHRAALLAGLRPVQPGLDGGFYRPRCEDLTRADPPPARAYALQRTTSETLSAGVELSKWNSFRLIEVDLTSPASFVAAWAPTHAWMAAEREPLGRVFRWAEWQARGTLHVVTEAPCARLRGELRVVSGAADVNVKAGNDVLYSGYVTEDWSLFETRPFPTDDALPISFVTGRHAAPDSAHALAVSRLALQALPRCGTVLWGADAHEAELPLDFGNDIEFSVTSPVAAACSRITFHIAGDRGGSIRVRVDDNPPAVYYLDSSTSVISTPALATTPTRRVSVSRGASAESQHWRIVDAVVTPERCP